MLKLNIISNSLKKELNLGLIYNSLKKFLLTSAALLLLYAIILLVGKYILQINFIDTVNQSTLVTKNVKNYNNQINTINEQMDSISQIQKNNIEWSRLISYLSQNLNQGIKLNQLKFDAASANMQISGQAETREDLLDFKKSLSKNENFGEINFPIKNLLEKNNINFDINVKIINYEFK